MTMNETYVFRSGMTGPIKIGTSKNIRDRLTSLQTGQHEKLQYLGVLTISEKVAHSHFADKRIRGEWFSITFDELVASGFLIESSSCPDSKPSEPERLWWPLSLEDLITEMIKSEWTVTYADELRLNLKGPGLHYREEWWGIDTNSVGLWRSSTFELNPRNDDPWLAEYLCFLHNRYRTEILSREV
jgi:hypothetical protein